MIAEVERDLRRSKASFMEFVWPAIGPLIGGGELISMEGEDDKLKALFDTTSGIDAWQYREGAGMWGIASRVQPIGRCYGTFTVRRGRKTCSRTEEHKLWEAVNAIDGRVFPKWFIQAYMTKDSSQLISAAACETRSLLDYIRNYCHERDVRFCSNASFWAAGWLDMRFRGFTVHTWKPGQEATHGR